MYPESDAFAGVSKKKTASIFKVEVSQFVADQSGSTYPLVAQLECENCAAQISTGSEFHAPAEDPDVFAAGERNSNDGRRILARWMSSG